LLWIRRLKVRILPPQPLPVARGAVKRGGYGFPTLVGTCEPSGVSELIGLLSDESARLDERDDAAIDLSKSD